MTHEHEFVETEDENVRACSCGETRLHFVGELHLTGEGGV